MATEGMMTARTPENIQRGTLSAAELSGEPAKWLPTLTGLLDEQRTLCHGLDALSVRQSTAVGVGDTDGLLRILGERQVIVDRVSQINEELAAFREHKASVMARLSPAQRHIVQTQIDAIAGLVDRVRVRDDSDRVLLEKQRVEVARELTEVGRGRGALAAYGTGAGSGVHSASGGHGIHGVHGTARFQDRQG